MGIIENSDFWQLWQVYHNYLYYYCLKLTNNYMDAEDVLSQAMLKAWEKLDGSTVE
ncbi:MAG: RNA polymerase sigma factor, partial [Dolichospermum sp.]